MKTTFIFILTIFGFISCRNDKELSLIIEELYNPTDSLRLKGLEDLEKFSLGLNQQILLLNKAKDTFPKAKYEWESIPGKLVEMATKNPDAKLVEIVRENFAAYDTIAKNASLRFLSGYDNKASIQTFKDLVTKYPADISFLSLGILDSNYSYKEIIFPDLLNVIDHEIMDAEILLLFLNYLNNDQLQAKDYTSFIAKILELSKKYRNIIKARQSLNIDIWDDSDYLNARFKSGIIEDLLGNFNGKDVVAELSEYLKLKDDKLRMLSAISLIKLGQEVDPKIIEEIAANAEARKWLFENLKSINKDALFPGKFKTQEAFAESDMINWLLYPTELARMPDAIELMKVVQVDSKSEDGIVEFYLFRFKSNHPDWKDNGWIAGVSGYFPVKDKPSVNAYGYTFSSFEKWDDKTPDQHIREIRELLEASYNKQE